MGFRLSQLFPKGGNESLYVSTVVNLNNAYEWGLPIVDTMSWSEIETYLAWIDAITSHLKFKEDEIVSIPLLEPLISSSYVSNFVGEFTNLSPIVESESINITNIATTITTATMSDFTTEIT